MISLLFRVLGLALILVVPLLVPAAPDSPAPWGPSGSGDAEIPASLQGRFPIALTERDGVDEVLVLSDRWIIVVTTNLPEISARIDKLTDGKFGGELKLWEASQADPEPDWEAWHRWQNLRDDHIIEARKLCGEHLYGERSFFTVASETDTRFAKPRMPKRVSRTYVGLDKARVPGSPDWHYAHYCYLELPDPMEGGNRYRVELGNGKAATFLFDLDRTVSRALKVNQAGYLPSARAKFAYLGGHVHGVGPLEIDPQAGFEIVDVDTGEVVLKGQLRERDNNSRFGEPTGDGPRN